MHPIVGKLISKLCSKLQIMQTLRENSHFSCTMKAQCLFNVGLSGVHYVYKCLDRAHFHDLEGYRFKLLVLIFHIYHFYRHDSLNYSFLASVIQYLTVVNNSLRMQKVFLSVKKKHKSSTVDFSDKYRFTSVNYDLHLLTLRVLDHCI